MDGAWQKRGDGSWYGKASVIQALIPILCPDCGQEVGYKCEVATDEDGLWCFYHECGAVLLIEDEA